MIICCKCKKEKTGNHAGYCKLCYNEYQRNHYLKNIEKNRARSLKWNKENYSKVKANIYRLRKENPEHYLSYAKEWKNRNKEKVSLWDKNKRHKRRDAKGGSTIYIQEWRDLLAKYKNKCHWCEKKFKKLTMDHYVPLSKGGSHSIENIVPSCLSCNCSKQDSDPVKYAHKHGRLF